MGNGNGEDMRRLSIILFLLIIASACSKEDPFEKSMRAGKDALLDNDYEEAVRQFDIALIENPSDKDAMALYSRSMNSLNEKLDSEKTIKTNNEAKQLIHAYESQMIDFVNELDSFENSLDASELTIEIAKSKLEYLSDLNKKLNSFHGEWEDNGKIISIHENLTTSILSIDSGLERFINNPSSKYNSFRISVASFKIEQWFEGVAKLKNH